MAWSDAAAGVHAVLWVDDDGDTVPAGGQGAVYWFAAALADVGAEREEGDVVVAEKHKADGEKGSAVQVDQQGPSVSSE